MFIKFLHRSRTAVLLALLITFGAWSVVVLADDVPISVTVGNVAPSFTVDVAESPASSPTTPTNAGDDLTFTATATDPANEDYYLVICDTMVVSPTNGGAPTCPGGLYAVSSATTSGAQASATYTTDASEEESDLWYAFVCDGNSTNALCSQASGGSGESGSPKAINHAPDLDSVSDNSPQNPGGSATFTGNAGVQFDVDAIDSATYPFVSDFETAGFTDWDTVDQTSATISQSSAEVFKDSNAMLFTGNGTGNIGYVEKVIPAYAGGNSHVISFFVYVENGELKNSTQWRVLRFLDGGSQVMYLSLLTNGSGDITSLTLNGTAANAGGLLLNGVDISTEFVMGAWNHIFIDYRVGTSVFGGAEAWVNGVSVGDSGFNDDTFGAIGVDELRLGNSLSGGGLVSSGDAYFDEFGIATGVIEFDQVKLVVCKTAGLSGATCDGGVSDTWCETALVDGDLATTDCDNTLDSVLPAGNNDAYYYLLDEHDMESTGAVQGSNSPYEINNVDPVVSNINLNGGSDISLTEGSTTTVYATHTVTDQNSCQDISFATANIYRSGQSATCFGGVDENDNYCYVVSCAVVGAGNTCDSSTDASADYECQVDIQYHADPTDAATQYPSEDWRAGIYAEDAGPVSDYEVMPTGVELNSLLGISVTPTIAYGNLNPGQSNDPIDQITTVTATGNVGLDVELSGTDMTDGGVESITVDNQRYEQSGVAYAAATTLTVSDTEVETNIPKTTITGSPETGDVYWGISIPFGTAAASYSGTNTVTAVKAETGDW